MVFLEHFLSEPLTPREAGFSLASLGRSCWPLVEFALGEKEALQVLTLLRYLVVTDTGKAIDVVVENCSWNMYFERK